jgi:two-component system response regulator PilR (NtrC family)
MIRSILMKNAVLAIKEGAFDYLTKPYAEKDLLDRVAKALAHRRVKLGNEGLKDRLQSGIAGRKLVYRSAAFGELVALLERAARTDASVLIQGESGTGKELLAHRLHDTSSRSDKPFVPVDCTAIPAELFESELFGHEKGAFSGAVQDKMGLFQVADGGTLFLDELGELPLPFQSKLLRAIQERAIRRVGANVEIPVDVRRSRLGVDPSDHHEDRRRCHGSLDHVDVSDGTPQDHAKEDGQRDVIPHFDRTRRRAHP